MKPYIIESSSPEFEKIIIKIPKLHTQNRQIIFVFNNAHSDTKFYIRNVKILVNIQDKNIITAIIFWSGMFSPLIILGTLILIQCIIQCIIDKLKKIKNTNTNIYSKMNEISLKQFRNNYF